MQIMSRNYFLLFLFAWEDMHEYGENEKAIGRK